VVETTNPVTARLPARKSDLRHGGKVKEAECAHSIESG